MTNTNNQLEKKNKKPSKLLTLMALAIAISLPYLLVNTFTKQNSSNYDYQSLILPKLQKQKIQTAEKSNPDDTWQIVNTQPGDTLSKLFSRVGLNANTLHAVMKNNPHSKLLTSIKPGQPLQFEIKDKILHRLIIPVNNMQYLVITKEADGYQTKIDAKKMNSHNHYVTATIQGSLFSTAKRLNIPYKLIHQMTEIFNWEIDFARDVRSGDRFTMIYKAYYVDDKLVSTGEIIAVSYTNKGKMHQAIRHVNRAGDADYYTPEGISLKKAFSRYPLKFSHISSTFNLSRFHPILHYKRPHRGVDLAARIGTPIMATGNGTIVSIGRQNAYGNMIKIKHDAQFSSIYGHMLRFQKGLSKGSKIKRGDIIGFVGQTGLASGPHCHYEFHVHNVPKNPSTIALPRSLPIPSNEKIAFNTNTHTLLAHLKLFEEGNLASSRIKGGDLG